MHRQYRSVCVSKVGGKSLRKLVQTQFDSAIRSERRMKSTVRDSRSDVRCRRKVRQFIRLSQVVLRLPTFETHTQYRTPRATRIDSDAFGAEQAFDTFLKSLVSESTSRALRVAVILSSDLDCTRFVQTDNPALDSPGECRGTCALPVGPDRQSPHLSRECRTPRCSRDPFSESD